MSVPLSLSVGFVFCDRFPNTQSIGNSVFLNVARGLSDVPSLPPDRRLQRDDKPGIERQADSDDCLKQKTGTPPVFAAKTVASLFSTFFRGIRGNWSRYSITSFRSLMTRAYTVLTEPATRTSSRNMMLTYIETNVKSRGAAMTANRFINRSAAI
jgi:hypothetical protein